ncbi:MAG: TldD/PmbA family protein [Candidatus Eremiobacteraeota bacterium]|nr:TldD/PmbA family protein [Candidatus Eremiobacteraeota bacterium]
MDSAAREALAERVLSFAPDGETEVLVFDVDSGLTRFTQNAIHQNVAHVDTSVRVRTIVDGRTGVVMTNALDDASLRAAVANARAIGALAPRDDDAAGLVANAPVAAPDGAFDTATATASPAERARVVADIVRVVEGAGLWAAGYVTNERSGITIANSSGTRSSYDTTSCGLNVKANGDDSTGFAERNSIRFDDLDGTSAGTIATEKTLASKAPVAVEPGEWTVILEPPAFGELLSYLTGHFSAQSYDEGSSFLANGLDRAYAGDDVTLSDDYAHPLFAGQPFDYEGYPTRRLSLLERGVAHELVTDSAWAKRLHRSNTGHGLPAPSAYGPAVQHLVVAGGRQSAAELVRGTKRGLLVTRFWYIRPVDHIKTIVTGMTRDGTFLIENGEIAGGVRNMRFNQSILEALGAATFSSEIARTGGYSYAAIVPTVKIENFRFSSGTDF